MFEETFKILKKKDNTIYFQHDYKLKNTKIEMLYYRFRSFTELSLKELMYNEMYFASTEKYNDPFDGKTFYSFDQDKEKWVNLILFVLNHIKPKPVISGEQLQAFTEYYCQKCPLSFEEIIENDLLYNFESNLLGIVYLKNILSTLMSQIVKRYKPF